MTCVDEQFFFFKQKTAYEMRISDWSSDVCSSDLLEIHLARRNDPDLDREVGPSTRRFDRRVRLWGYSILHAAGIKDDEAHMSLQLLNNAVTRGLTVEYIRNPNKAVIDYSIRIWKKQILDLLFSD